jgi:hypothetical protein
LGAFKVQCFPDQSIHVSGFSRKNFVSCSLIIWSRLMLGSATADLSGCASLICLLCSLIRIWMDRQLYPIYPLSPSFLLAQAIFNPNLFPYKHSSVLKPSHFPSYIVHTISSYLRGRTFEASFQTATSSRRGMRAGVAQGGLISLVLFSVYVDDMPSPSHHVEIALYADDTANIATSRKPSVPWSPTSTTFNRG